MAAEDQAVVVILCFVLVWFWRRCAQRRSAARARDAAAGRRMATFRRLQEDELALVTSIAAWRLFLVGVGQRRSVWMRPRSQAFFLDGTNSNEKKTSGSAGLDFIFFALSSDLASSKNICANALIC